MNSIEESFSRSQAMSLITLLRVLHDSIDKHPKRTKFLLKAMADFIVTESETTLFATIITYQQTLRTHFDSFNEHQKDYTITLIWDMITASREISEYEVHLAMLMTENITGIPANHFEQTIVKMEAIGGYLNSASHNRNTSSQVHIGEPRNSKKRKEITYMSLFVIFMLILAWWLLHI